MSEGLRVGFVTGTTPDKWARAWRDQRRGPLTLVPLLEQDQEGAVRRGEVDMALLRLRGDSPDPDPDLHLVRLYDELPVVVASLDHFVAAADTVTLDDLSDEIVWTDLPERDAIETVAAGTGVVVVPMSVARLFHRKDVVVREVTDLPPSTIALVWLRERDDEQTQAFVGVVRGRTARSSRG